MDEKIEVVREKIIKLKEADNETINGWLLFNKEINYITMYRERNDYIEKGKYSLYSNTIDVSE